MKIILLLEDLLLGGTQRQALQLAAGFLQAGHSPELWTLTNGDQLSELASQQNILVRKLGNSDVVSILTLTRLARHLRKVRPDILLCLTVLPNIWGRIVGKLCFLPVIIGACRGGGAPFRQHEKFLWPLARHIVCNSQALHTVLAQGCGVPEKRLSVIHNGIDTQLFNHSDTQPDAPTVLHVGRLVPDKNQETLIKAFSLVRKQIANAQLRIVGDGPLLDQLQRLAQTLLPKNSYQFVPGTTSIAPIYRQGTLFAMSSVREGLPNVVLEAMACGLPVVATRVGGIPELVEDGVTGLLVSPQNHEDMASSMITLLAHPTNARAFGRAGQDTLQKKFSLSASLSAHLALFDSFFQL